MFPSPTLNKLLDVVRTCQYDIATFTGIDSYGYKSCNTEPRIHKRSLNLRYVDSPVCEMLHVPDDDLKIGNMAEPVYLHVNYGGAQMSDRAVRKISAESMTREWSMTTTGRSSPAGIDQQRIKTIGIQEERQMSEIGQLAAQLIQDGKPGEAARILDAALSEDETSELWNDWATAEFACGHLLRAESGYRRALSLESSYRQAAVNFAMLLLSQGRLEESIPLLEPHRANLSEQERGIIGDLTSLSQSKVTTSTTTRSTEGGDNSQPELKGSSVVRPTGAPRSSPIYRALTLNIGSAKRQFFYRPESSDEGVINQIFRDGNYNLRRLQRRGQLVEYAQRCAAGGRTPLIIDAGANIGASPVFFSWDFPSARIVAVEPDAGNFDLLRANTEGLQVDCFQAAVHSRAGRVKVVDAGQGFWGYRTEPTSAADFGLKTASCVTINDVYASYSNRSFPFIVKVDIEGGEAELFSANTEWVSRTPLLIIELHDWMLPGRAASRPFLRCITDQDRDFVQIGENAFSIANDLTSIMRS